MGPDPQLRMRPRARLEAAFPDEEGLVARAAGGDREAFELLVRGHFRRIYGVLFRLVGNAEDAEDLAQETFVRAQRALEHLRDRAGFGAWLLRIAVHLARDQRRARGRRPASVPFPEDLAGRSPGGGGSELGARELRARLDAALDALPERQRIAFTLRVLEDLDYERVGPALGVTPKSARTLVSKARRELVRRLGPWMGEDGR